MELLACFGATCVQQRFHCVVLLSVDRGIVEAPSVSLTDFTVHPVESTILHLLLD